jgi:hypothetical protein
MARLGLVKLITNAAEKADTRRDLLPFGGPAMTFGIQAAHLNEFMQAYHPDVCNTPEYGNGDIENAPMEPFSRTARNCWGLGSHRYQHGTYTFPVVNEDQFNGCGISQYGSVSE